MNYGNLIECECLNIVYAYNQNGALLNPDKIFYFLLGDMHK
jgi:hypothetical protein